MGKEPVDTKTSPADEIEGILQDGKKKELNFVMMKTKDGIALKAGTAAVSHGKLVSQCKEAGGMPAVSMKGTMTVSGRTLQIVPLPDEPLDPSTLKKLARGVKPFCKALKMRPFKLVATLADGTVIDSDAMEEEGNEGEGEQPTTQQVPNAPVTPPPQGTAPNTGTPPSNDDPDAQMKAQLSERIKALVPQVKDAIGKAMAGADKFAKGLQAAGAEIGKGAYDQAAKLIDAVEQGLKAPQGNDPGVDPAAMREKLVQEFNAFSGDLQALGERAAENVAKKASQFAGMFQTELDGDLKKAAAILSALKKFVEGELKKAPPPQQQDVSEGGQDAEGLFDDIVGGVTGIAGTIKSTVSDGLTKVSETITSVGKTVVEGVQDVVTGLTQTDTEKNARASLDAFGFSREEREKMMEKMKTDPKAVEKFKTGKMTDAGVPPDRQAELLKMSETNPKAFVAALASLTSMKAVDTSPDAMQASLEEFQKARAANEIKQKELAQATTELADALKKSGELSGKAATAKVTADNAAQAIKDLAVRIGDPKLLTPEQRAEFLKESHALTNANELAKAELAKAIEDEKQASMDYAAASEKRTKAEEAADKTKAKQDETQKVNDEKGGKQSFLDALAFGPLSGTGPMADEDKAKFAEAFGKNAKVAGGAMNMMTSAKDPAAIAANVGFLADKANDGFADEDGNKLDLPADQIAAMTLNAARMGGEMGPDYFKGFGDYLKTGKQLDPDPSGGLDAPLAEPAETTRRKNVAQSRARDMATSALNPDGTVDFGSDAAKGQMDHMMFHPGSLNVFTPQMNLKAAETQKLFTDDTTKAKAQGIITNTTVPGPSTPLKPTSPNSSKAIIGKTMGKDPATVTDTDARASVLSAMMTPMSQGPVGSCFSTAPVRSIREQDPLRAMDEYSKIAGTGLFTPVGGPGVPANQRMHDGENPLMRSWEYSVATSAANINNSVQRQRVNKSLMRDDDTANNLGAVKGIMGATDAEWNGYNNPLTGDAVEGMKSKLLAATSRRLKFDYNATAPKGGVPVGGGDGHSTEGRYQLLFDGTAINSEDEFKAAIQAITLGVTGEAADSVKGAQIVTLVTGAPFIQSVKDALKTGGVGTDYMPWQLGGGGQEPAAKKVLDGGNPVKQDILANIGTPAPTRSERTSSVLTSVLGKNGSMVGDMHLIGTSGKDAGHAFNALPNDPSLDKIRDPDSAGKIDRELVQPGIKIASTALAAEQCAKMYRDEVSRLLSVLPSDEQAVLVGLMKNAPTTPLTPAEIAAKVKSEAKAVLPQVRADRYVKDKEPAADGPRKAVILTFFENNFDTGTGASIEANLREKMMDALQPPQVTVADSNWGGSENQVYFVAAPDPLTGDLIMWKRTDPGGKMAPLGKNWEDGPWNWTKP